MPSQAEMSCELCVSESQQGWGVVHELGGEVWFLHAPST
jgi:hypothetical protein